MLKWDFFDFVYPMAVFVSDSMRNFIFPLWNPYIYGGMPCVSDPQTYLFNPINLLCILLKGYSLELLQFQIFFIFFIAGINMYFCLKGFSLSKTASLVGAISFLGCGLFVGNTEHFSHISTLAFLPLSFLSLNKVLNMPNVYNLSLGALTVALLAFSGYPTMFVVCIYVLFLFGALKIFYIDQTSQRDIIFKKILYLFFFITLGLSISALMLIPVFENAMLSMRSIGLSLTQIAPNSLPIGYFGSMWFPFLALENFSSNYLEITLTNCSIGIIGFFFAIYYFIFNKTRFRNSLFLLLSLSAIMILGTHTPVYNPIIQLIPLIKHIRHPALDYRAIFLFFLSIAAGCGVHDMLQCEESIFKKSSATFVLFIFTALGIICYIKYTYNFDVLPLMVKYHLFWLVSISCLMIIVFLAKSASLRFLSVVIVVFCIIDVSHWVKVNFFTVADPVENDKWEYIKKMEQTRNMRVDNNIIFKRKEAEKYPIFLNDNFNMVSKHFTSGGYDPMILKHYDEIFKSPSGKIITEDFRIMPIYETRLLSDEESVLTHINSGIDLHRIALINEKDIRNRTLLERLKNLSPKENNNFSAKIIHYDPNSIHYLIKVQVPTLIFFNEIYYSGWHLFSNKGKPHLFRLNHAFRGTYLEPGDYNLKMIFFPLSFKIGLIISVSGFLFIFFSIIMLRPRPHQRSEGKTGNEQD